MSNGNKDRLTQAVSAIFIALVLLFIVLAVYHTGELTAVGRYKAEEHSAEYAADANQRIISDCLEREPPAMADCIREIIETTNEHQRSEYDLVAQSNMAVWALWMVFLSFISIVVTGAGVVYVALTLIEAKRTTTAALAGAEHARVAAVASAETAKSAVEANDLAKRLAANEQRPWISIDKESISIILRIINDDRIRLPSTFNIRNTGKTPANSFAHMYINHETITEDSFVLFDREIDRFKERPRGCSPILPGGHISDGLSMSFKPNILTPNVLGSVAVRFTVVITYDDMDGNVFQTCTTYGISGLILSTYINSAATDYSVAIKNEHIVVMKGPSRLI